MARQVKLSISYDGTVQTSQAAQTTQAAQAAGEQGVSGSSGQTYTVAAGDTLWAIAKRYYGNGARYTEIYAANAEQIEATARGHGKASSNNGHWIWPGEVLTIPGIGETSAAALAQATTVPTGTVVPVGTSNPALGAEIAASATSVSYTDVASGQSDSISITIDDIGKEWMAGKKPQRGASLGVSLTLEGWDGINGSMATFDCGKFILDDISFSGRPLTCVLNGVSVPAMDDFKSLPRTRTWEKTTIQDIASELTAAAGVALYYEADTIQIAEIEQSSETDSSFLYSLCDKYGLAMKVYNHKIVIFDIVKYEEKEAVVAISESDMVSWSYNTTIDGTYTGVDFGYTDPDVEDPIHIVIGSPGRMYFLNSQASSQYDAELQAAAKVNAANRGIETMEVTIRANTRIVASHCIMISGLGSIDGKYYVDKVKHSIGNRGYQMQLTLHKVQTPIKVNEPAAPNSGGQAYTVVSGDTLWGISKRFYGTGTKYTVIYAANAEQIEATARAHGKSSSNNGHWIWPGEILTIPEG